MKEVYIQMLEDNIEKIVSGTKTTTIRTHKQYEQIGMFVGETALTVFDGVQFHITNMGHLNIKQAGGKEEMIKSENFRSEGPSFNIVKNWLDGIGKMYVYKIEKI